MKQIWLVAVVILLILTTGSRAAEPYRLGPGDRIQIDVFEQPDLTKEVMIQADGSVRLPRVGPVILNGLTLAEAQDALAEGFKGALGLSDPDVTVEIASYRPVFVAGDVENPGAYAYVPAMTVMHAMSLAGGYRRFERGDPTARLEVGRLLERREQLRDQLAMSIARLARFEAERDEASAPVRSPELDRLVTTERADRLLAQESKTMMERKVSLDGALHIYEQRRGQLAEEITALRAQRTSKIEQVAVLNKELDSIKDLLEQGLISASRGYELQRTIIQAEADRLEIEAFIARARGEISSVDQSELNSRSERRLDIATGLKDSTDEIAQQRLTIAAVEAQVDVAAVLGQSSDAAVSSPGMEFDGPVVKRHGADSFVPIGFNDTLQPDDLLLIPSRRIKSAD